MNRHSKKKNSPIRLGFVPLSDCAPIAVAVEMGIFEKYNLNVLLSRELGWASVRDKIFHESLDAAESISGIAFALGFGINNLRSEIAVPLVLNLNGNAITLSNEIKPEDIGSGQGLSDYLTHHWKKDRPFTLAATHRFSSHHILIHQWLKRNGITSKQDLEIIFIPPWLMPRHLKAGHIDGYCVGEPWNSESILAGVGWCPATSADLSFNHPEKILVLSGKFVHERRDDSLLLTAALRDACKLCQNPDFRDPLISILALKNYTGASEDVLRNSLASHFNTGVEFIDATDFHIFYGNSVNRPTIDKASWVLSGLRDTNVISDITPSSLSRIYRDDLYQASNQYLQTGMSELHADDEIPALK
jgi:ABC-type nitrate/sulfonate/bicarbonate transport system substrate-binding protein